MNIPGFITPQLEAQGRVLLHRVRHVGRRRLRGQSAGDATCHGAGAAERHPLAVRARATGAGRRYPHRRRREHAGLAQSRDCAHRDGSLVEHHAYRRVRDPDHCRQQRPGDRVDRPADVGDGRCGCVRIKVGRRHDRHHQSTTGGIPERCRAGVAIIGGDRRAGTRARRRPGSRDRRSERAEGEFPGGPPRARLRREGRAPQRRRHRPHQCQRQHRHLRGCDAAARRHHPAHRRHRVSGSLPRGHLSRLR